MIEQRLRESISLIENSTISPIKEGYSNDLKFNIDHQYLLRVFPITDIKKRKVEFDTINHYPNYRHLLLELWNLMD